MKSVDIAVRTTEDGLDCEVTISIEQHIGGKWEKKKSETYKTGTIEAGPRTILLEDNERLVVEGKELVEYVYDKKAKAVVSKARDGLTAEQTRLVEETLQRNQVETEIRELEEAFEKRRAQLSATLKANGELK